jgi:hypothetical protein
MGFTCGLLLIAGAFSVKWNLSNPLSSGDDFQVLLLIAIFLAGLVLSVYHAFTDRTKTSFEKMLMLFFAVILNGSSGIMAGTYFLEEATGWLVIFPIMNIVNGAFLIVMLRTRVLDEHNIGDENASRGQVVFAGTMIIILFTLCNYVFDLLWVQTLSICVVYSTNLNRGMQTLFLRLFPKNRLA